MSEILLVIILLVILFIVKGLVEAFLKMVFAIIKFIVPVLIMVFIFNSIVAHLKQNGKDNTLNIVREKDDLKEMKDSILYVNEQ